LGNRGFWPEAQAFLAACDSHTARWAAAERAQISGSTLLIRHIPHRFLQQILLQQFAKSSI
jgi:hypothetical protein